jgi:hypothetical protein
MGKASSKKSEDRFPPRGISRFAVVVKRSGFRRRGLARLDHCQIHSAFRQSAKRKASSGVIEGRARRDTKLYIPVLDAVGERRFFRLKEGSPRYNPYSRTPYPTPEMFGNLKSKGCNLADTNPANADKLSTLLAGLGFWPSRLPLKQAWRRRGGGLSRSKSTAAGRGRCLPSASPRCGKSSPPQILLTQARSSANSCPRNSPSTH